jgi:hypothetical protein
MSINIAKVVFFYLRRCAAAKPVGVTATALLLYR